jgi:peroxiredoxin
MDIHHFPLPDNLPIPQNTQEAVHLAGHPLPPLIELPSTSGGYIDLFLLSLKRPVLLFIYPRTAAPGEKVPESWNDIPGARGCSPHLCGVRDNVKVLEDRERDLAIFGLSNQSTAYQSEAVQRLRLPFPLLSDANGELRKALDLPTFHWQGQTFLQRITLLLREGQITQVQYPVFPPNTAAIEALKMLDAGKSNPAAEGSNVINEQYCDGMTPRPSQRSVKPCDLTGTIRSYKALESLRQCDGASMSSAWRNSLVAVDNETGEVIGILAHNVRLSSASCEDDMVGCSGEEDDDDEHEARTPSGMDTDTSLYLGAPAHVYHDPDVRPRSRQGSVLGEDTFAPPPVPDKESSHLISAPNVMNDDSADVMSDGEVTDGFVRTRAQHVEAHQPGLLRDRKVEDDQDGGATSDASGSTIGGPVVQMWRKARGGRDGEKKRKAKKEAKRRSTLLAAQEQMMQSNASQSKGSLLTDTMPPLTTNLPPSVETVSVAKASRARRDRVAASDMQSIEDRVWQSALESGSLPIDAPYTHLNNALFGGVRNPKRSIANEAISTVVMQGNCVLLEFLAGSRIAASVICGAASNLMVGSVTSTAQRDARSGLAKPASITDGVRQYVPVIPDHLLWYFGMGTRQDVDDERSQPDVSATMATPTSYVKQLSMTAGNNFIHLSSAAPAFLLSTATAGASMAYNNITAWGWDASTWLGATIRHYVAGKQDGANAIDDLLDDNQPGEEDASEWQWSVPRFDAGSLSRTPRPVYRRKRPVPSLYQGFQVRERQDVSVEEDALLSAAGQHPRSSRYSIVHFDHEGYGRHAYLHVT